MAKGKTTSRRVDQYTIDGEFIATHESCRAGAIAAGVKNPNANNIASFIKRGTGIHCHGFQWAYTAQPDLPGEKWKKHPTQRVRVSTHGRVEGLRGGRTFGSVRWSGYMTTQVNPKCFLMHRLVAETWIPNPDKKAVVDHIDRCKTNNHVSNLRWATQKENSVRASPIE